MNKQDTSTPITRGTRRKTGCCIPPPRIALFDIGSNSIKLLIAEVTSPSTFRTLHFSRATTRLGGGSGSGLRIRSAALDATVDAILRFRRETGKYGCKKTFAFGTHALRTASDAQRAARKIERRAGIRLRILTGAEEAYYAFTSAAMHNALDKPHTILLDIGGGSTEFAYAHRRRIRIARSLPLGAIPLTERYLRSDPVTAGEYDAMTHEIERTVKRSRILSGVPAESGNRMDLVVSGGAMWTLVRMISHAEGGRPPAASGKVKRRRLQEFLERCLALAVNERKEIEGLEPERADIIVAGLAVVLHFMRKTNKRVLIANRGGVREGVLAAIIRNNLRWPVKIDPRGTQPVAGPRS